VGDRLIYTGPANWRARASTDGGEQFSDSPFLSLSGNQSVLPFPVLAFPFFILASEGKENK